MAKAAALTPAELLKQIEADEAAAYAEFEAKQKTKREKALADIIEPLKKERSELCTTVNDANSRISEIDKELAKLTGKKEPKATGGKRVRRPSEELAKELANAGKILFDFLKKKDKGDQIPVAELSKKVLGHPVKKALQPYIDAGLVGFHANGPKPLYSFIKDGEPKAE